MGGGSDKPRLWGGVKVKGFTFRRNNSFIFNLLSLSQQGSTLQRKKFLLLRVESSYLARFCR